MPASVPTGVKFPVVYLLHGGDGNFRDWTNYSDVARFAERGLVLVMPDGDESYYTNSADHPDQPYEDYIVKDLIADVETQFPTASDRAHRAIAGVSMGGFGAVKLSLKHPELFSFAAGLSSALDVPSRPFSIHAGDSGDITAQSSVRRAASLSGRMIRSYWPDRPIPRQFPTSI
jgi:putative tributyrin esterase